MNSTDDSHEAWLHAYIDDELAPSDRYEVLQQLLVDEELRGEVCDLLRTKELVRQAFIEPPLPPRREEVRRGAAPWRRVAAVAAVFVFAVLSFVGGRYSDNTRPPTLAASLNRLGAVGLHEAALKTNPKRVLLHIAAENNVKFAHTLDQAAHLLGQYGNKGLVVEVVVNGGALNLLQADDNPYAKRVHALLRRYPNLHIVACGTGIRYLKSRGFPIDLMHQVRVAPSAIEEIVKRLREGWVYVNA